MVKLKSPFGSIAASGKLGDVLSFRTDRHGASAGRKRNPKQPRTIAQRATRLWLSWLSAEWATLTTAERATWANHPDVPILSPYHAFISYNTERWQTQPGERRYPDYWHFAPSSSYPAPENTVGTSVGSIVTGGGPGMIWFNFTSTFNVDIWTFAYHLKTTEHPWPCRRNLVAILNVTPLAPNRHEIHGLQPGVTELWYSRLTRSGLPDHYYRQIIETVT